MPNRTAVTHPDDAAGAVDRGRRTGHRAGRRTALLAVLVAAVLAVSGGTAVARVRPLVNGNVGDPSVAQTKGRHYVLVGTGAQVLRMSSTNGRRWHLAAPALLTRPAWARPQGDIWASDIVRLRGRWVLYYAAPVRGLTGSSRCIGVATASSPTGRFQPFGNAPLVCPPGADTPPAADQVVDPGQVAPTLPTTGAIDPSVFQGAGGVWLLYKTDGRPSSIRIVPLVSNGLTVSSGSRPLLASSGVIENPVLVKRGRFFYLFTSEGDYTTCGYGTVLRRSADLLSWRHARTRRILTKAKTGLCGPGGADVLVTGHDRRARFSLYFHAWTCRRTGKPCRDPFRAWDGREDYRLPVRSLYGVELKFTKRKFPILDDWLRRRH